jgi:CheY-like chemotaxis protein
MKRILIVDDDALVLELYRQALTRLGYEVEAVADSLAAISRLQTAPPELVVLDLMMPRFTGVDVVKFIRTQPALAHLPVIVLSNCYLDGLAEQAAALGVNRSLLKVRTSPALLHKVIEEIASGSTTAPEPSALPAAPSSRPPQPGTRPRQEPAATPPAPVPVQPPRAPAPLAPTSEDTDFRLQARQDFLAKAPAHAQELHRFYSEVESAAGAKVRLLKLENLYRKVHFTSAAAGLAECQRVALMASAFEAFLFELTANPARLSASAAKTMQAGSRFL